MTQHRNLTRSPESPELGWVREAAEGLALAHDGLQGERYSLMAAMRKAKSNGHTLQEIGDAAGITRERVRQLLNKEPQQ